MSESNPLTVEQQFLVGPGETFVTELEKVVDAIAGKLEDPGFLQPVSKRVAMVVKYLESQDGADVRLAESLKIAMGQLTDLVAFKPGDPGPPYSAHERVIAVIAELERTIAKQRATLEAIVRAEGM
jgi:hypothetical protein